MHGSVTLSESEREVKETWSAYYEIALYSQMTKRNGKNKQRYTIYQWL